jgi:hypothetical protein
MATIRSIDMLLIDDAFEMGSGYVLNFSDRTFAEFFATELKRNINDPTYARNGTSKAKRLRCFLLTVDNPTAVETLQALWEYREALRLRDHKDEAAPEVGGRISELIHRLGGPKPQVKAQPATKAQAQTVDPVIVEKLARDLVDLSRLDPQPRGYAFEAFLKRLFDVHGLEGREPFRLRGEQIDGSFVLANEIYLLEARWQSARTGAADLLAFNGKLENKAAWTRGLFVSQSGFTDEGLHAFGRGKRVLCMDGLDLYDTLSRRIPLTDVLDGKFRRAAETGMAFVRVRDLFSS